MDSWDLKFDRAARHLKELRDEIDRFAARHPYRAVPIGNPNRHRGVRRFKLQFTEKPDAMVPVMVGDVLHNVRSGLDHLVGANVPRKRRRQAGFPIFTESPFGEDGEPLDNDRGDAWKKLTTGLPKPLLAQVRFIQPFNGPPPETAAFCVANGLEPNEIQALAILSRLDNADKHRELIVVPWGLEDGTITYRCPGTEAITQDMGDGFVPDGAELPSVNLDSVPQGAEVSVEVEGTVRIAMEVREEKGVAGLPGSLEKLIDHAREIADYFTKNGGFRTSDA